MHDYFQSLIANCASEWRSIPGYEGSYEANIKGEVRSLDRLVPHGLGGAMRTIHGKKLSPAVIKNRGYRFLGLTHCGSKSKIEYVHRCVWDAFNGKSSRSMEIDHIDGDTSNNNLWNLRLVTRRQNMRNILRTDSRSGYRGVRVRPGRKMPWTAYISVDGKTEEFGPFATREEAIEARKKAQLEFWGNDSPEIVRK